jgi:MYXO-CTERM domain-containing protein
MNRSVLALSLGALISLSAADVSANTSFPPKVPNINEFETPNCLFCHSSAVGGSTNLAPFGQWLKDNNDEKGFYTTGAEYELDWAAVAAEDYDGDGFTNGEELTSDPPSDPRDADATPGGGDPDMGGPDMGSSGASMDEEGSCSVAAPSRHTPAGVGLLALLGLALGALRRFHR